MLYGDGLGRICIGCEDFPYRGRIPEGRRVFLDYDSALGRDVEEAVFASCLEIMGSGGIPVVSDKDSGPAFEALKCLWKPIVLFSSLGSGKLERKKRKEAGLVVSSGGAVVYADNQSVSYSRAGVLRCLHIASSFSDCVLFASDSRSRRLGLSHRLICALDEGKDIAVLRSALAVPALRSLASEGCPIACTYSDLLSDPACIAYRDSNGKYGYRGQCFGIIVR